MSFAGGEILSPYLSIYDFNYSYYDLCGPGEFMGCGGSFSLLPPASLNIHKSTPFGDSNLGHDWPSCWPWVAMNHVCLGRTMQDGKPELFWQAEKGGQVSWKIIGNVSPDDDIDWSIELGSSKYTGMAYADIDGNFTDELFLPRSKENHWEIRNPQTGALIDSLTGLPPADIRTAPIMELDVLDLYYFLDSTLYILDRTGMPTGILAEENAPPIPETFTLHQNYPNPFNTSTIIEFELGQPGLVKLEIYNILGKKVAVLLDEYHPAGIHRTEWDGTDLDGRTVVSGIYFYRLAIDVSDQTRKMVLLK